jgi:hypothetical protein
MAMPRNLQRRPAKPALGNGRIQRAVRRAFYFDFELTSSDVYDWVYPRRRHLLTQAHRHSARRGADDDGRSDRACAAAWRMVVAIAQHCGVVLIQNLQVLQITGTRM